MLLTDGTSVVARTVTVASGQFTLNVPDSGDFESASRSTASAPSRWRSTGASAARDLGTIALEISAVSESVVVSAAQVEIPLSAASSSVTVITRDDLDKHQVESVADALRAVPGLTVVANGGRGAVTSVFPRGGESDYSLVLVDGVQANAFGGGFDFAHLPVANIERIEIVRGPQSALYGSNAIGSVVRIVTRQSGAPDASASLEGGGFDTFRATAATSGTVGRWHWGAVDRAADDRQLQRHSARRPERLSRTTTTSGPRRRRPAAGGTRQGAAIRGNVRYATDERGSPGPFGADPGRHLRRHRHRLARHQRPLADVGGGSRADRPRTHQRRGDALAARQRVREPVRRFRVVFAAHDRARAGRRDARARLRDLGRRRAPRRARGRHLHHRDGQRARAGQAGRRRVLRRGALEPRRAALRRRGLRVDRITREALAGDADAFSPRPPFASDTVVSANPKVSAAWFLGATDGNFTKLRGSAGTGIRPPDAFEIAFTDNPSLEPERSKSFDAGVEQALARRPRPGRSDGVLQQLRRPDCRRRIVQRLEPYRTDNISNARARGLELAGTARVRR